MAEALGDPEAAPDDLDISAPLPEKARATPGWINLTC
jgi:hypothetical protein